jgi:DNA-binding NarL/FixJ family response regulator
VGEAALAGDAITRRLAICEKTVRNHLGDVFEKLGVHGRLELLLSVNQHGLGRLRSAAPSAPP